MVRVASNQRRRYVGRLHRSKCEISRSRFTALTRRQKVRGLGRFVRTHQLVHESEIALTLFELGIDPTLSRRLTRRLTLAGVCAGVVIIGVNASTPAQEICSITLTIMVRRFYNVSVSRFNC